MLVELREHAGWMAKLSWFHPQLRAVSHAGGTILWVTISLGIDYVSPIPRGDGNG
jgi:hypothetical protein